MNPWWLGLAPAQTTVHCAGRDHEIRWDAGQLSALDHEDPEGERALAALAGQRRPCIDLLDAWERHQDDARVLVLATPGPADQLAASDDRNAHLGLAQPQVLQQAAIYSAGWTGYAPTGRISKAAQAENELIALLTLGGGLHDRLVGTVAAAWRERLRQPDRAPARVPARAQSVSLAYGICVGIVIPVKRRVTPRGSRQARRSTQSQSMTRGPLKWAAGSPGRSGPSRAVFAYR